MGLILHQAPSEGRMGKPEACGQQVALGHVLNRLPSVWERREEEAREA